MCSSSRNLVQFTQKWIKPRKDNTLRRWPIWSLEEELMGESFSSRAGVFGCGIEFVISESLFLTMLPKDDLFSILSPFILLNLNKTLVIKSQEPLWVIQKLGLNTGQNPSTTSRTLMGNPQIRPKHTDQRDKLKSSKLVLWGSLIYPKKKDEDWSKVFLGL